MLKFSLSCLASALLIAGLAATGAQADGGSSVPSAPTVSRTPEQEAANYYNSGLRLRDKAWALEKKAAAATSEGERQKLEGKIAKTWERAIRDFESATRRNPGLHQAYGSLGYALRKTGQYERSLEAYDQSLALAPGYTEAIEYRAEAYLGLNRLSEAKEAYLQLMRQDRERADKLMEAMQSWVEMRHADPAGLEPAVIEEFASWVEERQELAQQTASLSSPSQDSW